MLLFFSSIFVIDICGTENLGYFMHQNDFDKNIVAILPHLNSDVKRFSKKVNVFLTDLKGQILIEQQNADYIDISNQPKGYYLAFLTDVNGSLIKRIRVIKK